MPIFATADQIAPAIVASARIVGVDPLMIYQQHDQSMTRTRLLAYLALTEAIEDVGKLSVARGLGLAAAAAHAIHYRKKGFPREDDLDEVIGAILAPEIDDAEAGAPVGAAPAQQPSAEDLRRFYRSEPPPKRARGRSVPLGEPEPGRSALDRRLATGGDDEAVDTDGRRRSRKRVTLPGLKILERDAP